ncbi:MAG: choice-of-anchor D domain-containing protein [Ignavibacteria bacterium]|nr:choice-of-anchor D domain-containing protein [Ignavibacteria bacterium]
MKKITFIFLMFVFLLPTTGLFAQKTMGTLYEFMLDPSLPTTKAENTAVTQWFIDNFDENNIPLFSYTKITDASAKKLYGIDSAYKRNPVEIGNRWLFWTPVFEGDENYTRVLTAPYFIEDPPLIGFLGATGKAGLLDQVKAILDTARQSVGAPVYVQLTSEMEGGYYNIEATYTLHPQIEGDASFMVHIVLAEAYHAYGDEKHYFLPRNFLTGSRGEVLTISSSKKTMTQKYQIPIEKEWNTKYLYVVGWTTNGIKTYDATTDRVINVNAAKTAKPLKLEIKTAEGTNFQKVQIGSKSLVTFSVSNPTAQTIKAEAYLDPETSAIPDGWQVSLNKTNLIIPAGQTTTVTATVDAVGIPGVCGLDFCVRPYETDASFNPIITSKQAVITEKNVRAIIFAGRKSLNEYRLFRSAKYYTAYNEEIGLLDPIFHTAVPATAFDAYIYNNTTPFEQDVVTNIKQSNSVWVNFGTYNYSWQKDENNLMATHLSDSELKFLLEVQGANKHLALFTDKSYWYFNSNYATSESKINFSQLCSNFGVSIASDTTFYYDGNYSDESSRFRPALFQVKTNASDSLGQNPKDGDRPYSFHMNNNAMITSMNNTTLYANKFNIVNSSKSTSIAYYEPSITSNAMVKTRNGNQKLFIGGFSLSGLVDVQISNLLVDNLFTWWFGYKKKLEPKIELYLKGTTSPTNNLNFGEIEMPNSKTHTMIVKNAADSDQGDLKIYDCTFDFNEDEAFEVVSYPTDPIKPGEGGELVVKFTPKVEGEVNISLSIESNDPNNSPYTLYIKGKGKMQDGGPEPIMIVTPNSNYHNFKLQEPDTGPYSYNINIYNEGGVDLNVSMKLETTSPAGTFTLKDADFDVVKTSDIFGKDFQVVFTPPYDKGDYSAKLTITSNDKENKEFIIEFDGASTGKTSILDNSLGAKFSVNPTIATNNATVEFTLIENNIKNIKISILDLTGKHIQTIADASYAPGEHKVIFDVTHLPSGNYFIGFNIDGKLSTIPFKVAK